ncbi:MAG: flagellar basal body rod protein FlgB [Myxococcales bacterium]|nr:flagellar basal body rod protein FlgB [Myxococcota bacterium]MDW8282826.1 flagellar basal body rod protein FlgB [Myxococcales bacterium]
MSNLFSGTLRLEQSLDYHQDRHILLTSNIANVDTPGYRPVDLGLVPAPPAGELRLVQTHARHIDPQDHPPLIVPFEDPSPSPGNDQNAVDLDRELVKIAANTIRYETASELVARRLALLRYAAGDLGTG